METEKQITEVSQKFEVIQLAAGENIEHAGKLDDTTKRGSLSKFFRFKGLKSSGSVTDVSASSTTEKISKTNTLTRLFNRKKTIDVEAGSDATTRRSFIMRGLVVPWINSKQSHVDLRKPLEIPVVNDDESPTQEIASSSEIF